MRVLLCVHAYACVFQPYLWPYIFECRASLIVRHSEGGRGGVLFCFRTVGTIWVRKTAPKFSETFLTKPPKCSATHVEYLRIDKLPVYSSYST